MSFRGAQRWRPEIGKKTSGVHFCQKRGLFSLLNFRKFRQMFLLILTLFRMLKIAGRVILKIRNSSFHSCPPDVTHDENSEIETVLLSNECTISS